MAFVLSLNLHRRHLNASQRAMVAERVANIKSGEFAGNQHVPSANLPRAPEPASQNQSRATPPPDDALPPSPKVSQANAAKLLNVSTRLVTSARKVRTEAQPELVKAVEQGKIPVSVGAKLVNEPAPVQRQVAEKVMSGESKSVTRCKGAGS